MTKPSATGIGELLRHLSDLFDRDAERIYQGMGVSAGYRARYTPIIRCFADQPLSITELQQRIRITQGAVSQTVKLMVADGLLNRVEAADHRMRKVTLTHKGEALKRRLSAEWELHLTAISALEIEIAVPLREHLLRAITALERESYLQRIERIRKEPSKE